MRICQEQFHRSKAHSIRLRGGLWPHVATDMITRKIRLRFLIVLRLFQLLNWHDLIIHWQRMTNRYQWSITMKQAFTIVYTVVANPCWVCDEICFIEPTLKKRDSRFESSVHASLGDVLNLQPDAHL